MLPRTLFRSARAAAARPAPFAAIARPQFQNAAPRIVASRFYATEGEAKAEEKTEESEADKIKKELEAKNKEVSDFKACQFGVAEWRNRMA